MNKFRAHLGHRYECILPRRNKLMEGNAGNLVWIQQASLSHIHLFLVGALHSYNYKGRRKEILVSTSTETMGIKFPDL